MNCIYIFRCLILLYDFVANAVLSVSCSKIYFSISSALTMHSKQYASPTHQQTDLWQAHMRPEVADRSWDLLVISGWSQEANRQDLVISCIFLLASLSTNQRKTGVLLLQSSIVELKNIKANFLDKGFCQSDVVL